MPETPEGLLARLAAAGIAAETRHHRPVFTVAESRDLRGDLPGGHTKNLFLRPAKGEGPFLLATLEEERQVSVNALARLAGAGKVRMASAEELQATLGVPPGAVTPFGLVNAAPGTVRFVMDRHLAEGFDRIWVHPLTNAASTGLAPADLLRFLAALGHPALLLDLPAAP
ncbi:prolyl-tRNA synthetase associated domain-containing protein [Roseomonas alkaliterrae]|jgi:Ala-tRNA(Pro) deacylase|uniref:Ala-tRNA(Pro) deacylase n=1 Tax=Neoroseomonas alkaliterrae TaxID=1452450 RepID=A0A840YBX6_9PROT|nr:prolyl-tRNA synthetase associated domain-containing protein [Neoroseomonas alkaliterrae]MBB5691384.1 Ala-tRNA(Pro) deacylase [Neoroseomonas alkaliterrae]MBR0675766.1 prolyl-tRNA synthetase associated domain-containing protein [Neoroseomonas alkaliterrae]